MNDLKENNIGTKDTKITRLPLTSDGRRKTWNIRFKIGYR